MNLFKKFKTEFLDFEHPPKPRNAAILDALLIGLILIVYALIQHVIPMHFFEIKFAAIKTRYAQQAEIEQSAVITPAPTIVLPSPTPAPVNPEEMTLAEKFADKFSSETVFENGLYKSSDVSIEISEHSSGEGNLAQHWYVADIYVSDVHCLQTYMFDSSYSYECGGHISKLSQAAGSIVAVNGDYALTTSSGVIIRNGEVLRDSPALAQICVLYENGEMECFSADEYDSDAVMEKNPWQAWTFGPSLLDSKGRAITEYSSYYGQVLESNPRTVLGYYEPGHYCFVLIDGRQSGYALGLEMDETALLMEELGCTLAFNLDGGRSSQMTWGTEFVNIPYKDGRYVGDIVYIKDIFREADLNEEKYN